MPSEAHDNLDLVFPQGDEFIHIIFRPDGQVDFYAQTEDPERLAVEFGRIIIMLYEAPELILHAVGACAYGGRCRQ